MRPDIRSKEAPVLLSENHISLIIRIAWRSLLGSSLQRRAHVIPPGDKSQYITTQVRIMGAWEGSIVFDLPRPLLRKALVPFFNLFFEGVTEDLLADVAKELVNTVGGQIKALLNGPCRLSLPALTESPRDVKDLPGEIMNHILFDVDGHSMQVVILKGS
jgi:hypothetical protein